jgi:hypothetical protein
MAIDQRQLPACTVRVLHKLQGSVDSSLRRAARTTACCLFGALESPDRLQATSAPGPTASEHPAQKWLLIHPPGLGCCLWLLLMWLLLLVRLLLLHLLMLWLHGAPQGRWLLLTRPTWRVPVPLRTAAALPAITVTAAGSAVPIPA